MLEDFDIKVCNVSFGGPWLKIQQFESDIKFVSTSLNVQSPVRYLKWKENAGTGKIGKSYDYI